MQSTPQGTSPVDGSGKDYYNNFIFSSIPSRPPHLLNFLRIINHSPLLTGRTHPTNKSEASENKYRARLECQNTGNLIASIAET